MDWKKYDKTIRQFASELDCEIEEDAIHSIDHKVQVWTFRDKDLISYEFRHAKPVTSYGSRIKVESAKGNEDIYIKSKQIPFFKPKLKIKKGHLHSVTLDKLRQLQKSLGEFEWHTNGTLRFTTKIIDLDIQTLLLIREIHLEIKG